jgi:hypothetical protein
MSEKADWKGVGDSLKSLGAKLSAHATEGSEQVKSAAGEAGESVVDQTKAGAKAALGKFDETTKDPDVSSAVKDTTNKFLDALKVQLTGGDAPTAGSESDHDPEPPKPIEPPIEPPAE